METMIILKMDYDNITWNDVLLIYKHRSWLLRKLKLRKLEVSTTVHGYHVRAWIEEKLKPAEIILAQVLLGSDIQREIFNFIRAHRLEQAWNKLFTKKYIILKTTAWKEISREKYSPNFTADLKAILRGRRK